MNPLICDALRRIGTTATSWSSDLEPQLSARLALQLHRLTTAQLADENRLSIEHEKAAAHSRTCLDELKSYLCVTKKLPVELRGRLVERSGKYVEPIHHLGHYLRSSRITGRHFELVCANSLREEVPVGVVSFSPSDLGHLTNSIEQIDGCANTWILTRLITYPWSPRNTASYLVARALRALRCEELDVGPVLSYCDRNVGFSGGIYRALNARLLLQERKQRYAFEKGEYVSDRYLIRKYGSAHVSRLRKQGIKVGSSTLRLTPLDIWYWPTKRSKGFEHRRTLSVYPSPELVGV